MSVPQNVMQRMQQSQSAGAPLPGGAMPGPAGSPMATPQAKDGKRESARLRVHIAMNMLEQALPDFGAETDEGEAILKTLTSLGRKFGNSDVSDLVPAEIQAMNSSLTQAGGGTPQQQQILKMQAGNGPAKIPGASAPMPAPMM